MKKRFFTLGLVLIYTFMLFGCNDSAAVEKSTESGTKQQTEIFTQAESAVSAAVNSEYFSERDFRAEYSEVGAVKITLNGDSVSCDSAAVKYSDSVLSIKS